MIYVETITHGALSKVPIAIVAHPRRAAMATNLATEVGASAICWDVAEQGAEANHLRAWDWLAEADDYDTGWGVVLEDDVLPCPAFTYQLADCLQHSPSPIVGLYLGRGRPPHRQQDIAAALGSQEPFSFLVSDEMLSCQGYAMRTGLFRSRAALHALVGGRWGHLPIDEGITKWIREVDLRGLEVAYPVPSLVDHRPGPSLVTHWDEDTRDGKTALMADDCDPSGANLPEVRKAWLWGRHNQWTSTSIRLGKNFTEGDA